MRWRGATYDWEALPYHVFGRQSTKQVASLRRTPLRVYEKKRKSGSQDELIVT